MANALIGPERIAHWVKARLEQELRGNLPGLDLEGLAKAGVKAIRLHVMGVGEQAKDFVRQGEKAAAEALRKAGEDALRSGSKRLKKRLDDLW